MTRFDPLRGNVDFRRYWLGQLTSSLGSQLSLIAYPLLVLALGGTPAQAGGIATASLVARLAFRLPAGLIVDHVDRRRLMLCADLVRAVAVGSIPLAALLSTPTYPHLLTVALIEGIAASVFGPAAAVAVRQLVPPEQLADAMALSHARLASVTLVGPTLGGWLFTVNRFAPFIGDALSYLVSALQLSRIRTPLAAGATATGSDRGLLAGMRWLLHARVLRNVYSFAGMVNLTTQAAVLATIVTAEQRGVSGTVIGVMLTIVGAGSVVGALIAPMMVRRVPAWALFCALGVALTGALGVLSVITSPFLVGGVLGTVLVLSPTAGILVGKTMLLEAPRHLYGRVTVAGDMIQSGPAAAGPLVTGVLLGSLGAGGTWLILVGVTGAATLAALPTFRTPGFLADPAPAQVEPETAGAGSATRTTEEKHVDVQ